MTTTTLITDALIRSTFDRVLKEVSQVIPVANWAIEPTGLDYTDKKVQYGAATKDGLVLINLIFVGSTASRKLEHTLRHEFAHLAVGIKHHHNRVFKRVERSFNAALDHDLSTDIAELNKKIHFKYSVFAFLASGKELDLGGVHRKTKRYTNYPNEKGTYLSIKGDPVLKFEFRPYKL